MSATTRSLTAVLAVLLLTGCGADRARINTLRGELQQLRGELRRQHERIVELERAAAAQRGLATLVGGYTIDADALATLMLPDALEVHREELAKLDPTKRAKREQEIKSALRLQAQSLQFSLLLAPDGTCELDPGTVPGEQPMLARGTWRVEGDRLTLDLTNEGEEPDVMSARIEGTRLYLDDPKLVLHKR